VKVTRFDPEEALIIIPALVWGAHRRRELRMALDTGAGETIILPEILDQLGYNPRHGEAITKVRSAVAEEPGYLLRVVRFRALGHEFTDFRIHAHDLPEGVGIDGLLGLNFLRHFNYEIRSGDGKICVERLAL
jgi:hypothetical protein